MTSKANRRTDYLGYMREAHQQFDWLTTPKRRMALTFEPTLASSSEGFFGARGHAASPKPAVATATLIARMSTSWNGGGTTRTQSHVCDDADPAFLPSNLVETDGDTAKSHLLDMYSALSMEQFNLNHRETEIETPQPSVSSDARHARSVPSSDSIALSQLSSEEELLGLTDSAAVQPPRGSVPRIVVGSNGELSIQLVSIENLSVELYQKKNECAF